MLVKLAVGIGVELLHEDARVRAVRADVRGDERDAFGGQPGDEEVIALFGKELREVCADDFDHFARHFVVGIQPVRVLDLLDDRVARRVDVLENFVVQPVSVAVLHAAHAELARLAAARAFAFLLLPAGALPAFVDRIEMEQIALVSLSATSIFASCFASAVAPPMKNTAPNAKRMATMATTTSNRLLCSV